MNATCARQSKIPLGLELTVCSQQCLKQIADTPAKIETESSDLPEWEKILSGLRKLEPDAARIKTLRDVDIPRMEEELRRIEVRHTNVTAKAEEVKSSRRTCRTGADSLYRRRRKSSAG